MTRRITRWPLYVHHRHDDEPSNRATPLCGTQLSEVAVAVSFLASESAGYVTGALITVDGGLSI
ncbi:SDR family oxidoreductase [Mycobacterium sp. NAZ190054]|uniref:SDR family oxidoreductase n=1 Tax=Mycobacterium sp. NAZ190054 TaxID=1747766 RepID=UPI0009E97A88|nr:SDR family oxidoreductase [Mycobacterium sp. NAZ190054]